MKILFLVFLLIASLAGGQEKQYTENGNISFNASTPLENINAESKTVKAVFDASNGEFAAVALIRNFKFKNSLMQEHFNENYMESDTYPKATFLGILEGFDGSSPKCGTYNVKGSITIHGVTKPLATPVRLNRSNKNSTLEAEFILRPGDYDIKIPRIVFTKIAQRVKVKIHFVLAEK